MKVIKYLKDIKHLYRGYASNGVGGKIYKDIFFDISRTNKKLKFTYCAFINCRFSIKIWEAVDFKGCTTAQKEILLWLIGDDSKYPYCNSSYNARESVKHLLRLFERRGVVV